MGTKKYLLIVDTVGNKLGTQVFGAGMMDMQIISATDPAHAKLIYLNTQPNKSRAVLTDCLYIYDLGEIVTGMDDVEKRGGVPVFRFIQPGGRRPPKPHYNIAERVQVKLDNQTVGDKKPDTYTPGLREADVRHKEFQEPEYIEKSVSENFSEDQRRILRNVGADKTSSNMDERFNLKVHASVANDSEKEQEEILRRLQISDDYGNVSTESQPASDVYVDPELTQVVNDKPLSREELKRLLAEAEEMGGI